MIYLGIYFVFISPFFLLDLNDKTKKCGKFLQKVLINEARLEKNISGRIGALVMFQVSEDLAELRSE